MNTRRNTGRLIGALFVAQFVGLLVGFILLLPAIGTDYLSVAAGVEAETRTAVVLLLAAGAVTFLLALVAFPVFRDYSERTALWFLTISAIWIVMQSDDSIHILSMLSLSKRYAQDP